MKFHFRSRSKKITRELYQKQLLKKRKKTRLRPWVVCVLCAIFTITVIVNLVVLFSWRKNNNAIDKLVDEINDIVEVAPVYDESEVITEDTDTTASNDYWDYMKLPFYDVDFDPLIKKNSDTVGFINVKNTNINYPVVQSTDNDYYLNHAFDKSYNDAGWVYLDYRNNSSFSDFNSIIYGHGRLNGTVFGSLKDLLSDSWQSDSNNYIINISTPSVNFIYQIFSIYTIEKEFYYIKTEFANYEEKRVWVNTMKKRDTANINIGVNTNDKIITLSTCLDNYGGRIVVHAKMIRQQKKEVVLN